jgi:cytosine/adenosine deaminase-related metal-dependent hydrolase
VLNADRSSGGAQIPPEHGVFTSTPLATHLAETVEEQEFIANGRGPHREFLERIGVWSREALDDFGRGRTPVEHLFEVLRSSPFVAAHVNDADDEAIRLLSLTRTTVAYCPRASDYFGAAERFGPHRYRDMLAAGINVALGTDSIVNLPGDAATVAGGGMSVLDEMRHLFRRDASDPVTLLKLGTLNGALALGLEPGLFRLGGEYAGGREIAGLVAVEAPARGVVNDPARLVMDLRSPARPLFCTSFSGEVGTG